ncbi:MAG: hypothetical protein IKM23_03360 [Bacteroidales bacterium]|nr:hypothetical protein [Bacteroidales bacterium]
MFLDFKDKSVPYEVFVKDVATRIVRLLDESRHDPVMVSQRKAYEMFGRGNVERWRKQGKAHPCKRPGKVEYNTAELRELQRVEQDYLNQPTKIKTTKNVRRCK